MQLGNPDSGVRPAVIPVALAASLLGVLRTQLVELRRLARDRPHACREVRRVLVQERPRLAVQLVSSWWARTHVYASQ